MKLKRVHAWTAIKIVQKGDRKLLLIRCDCGTERTMEPAMWLGQFEKKPSQFCKKCLIQRENERYGKWIRSAQDKKNRLVTNTSRIA